MHPVKMPQALTKISRRYIKQIHAFHFKNLVKVFHCNNVFNEDDRQGFSVRSLKKIRDPITLTRRRDAALAQWRKFGCIGNRLGLITRVDMRHTYALTSQIKRSINRPISVLIHANNRRHPPQVSRSRQVRNITKIHRSVLAFQPYSIEAHRPEHIDHVRCHNRTHYTYGNITVRHFLFDPVGPKTRHNNSKRPVAAAVWPRSSSGATTTSPHHHLDE